MESIKQPTIHRIGVILALAAALAACRPPNVEVEPVRVAVIGGIVMSGLWDMLAEAFTADTGIPVELVAVGNKEVIGPAFRQGGIDLITLHSSDTATKLAAEGLAVNMRPWAFNELVIVGPEEDPARLRGMTDGTAALQKIADGRHPFVAAANTGSHTIAQHLWKKVGLRPAGDWVIQDGSAASQLVVQFAREHDAYVIVGRIPVLQGKIPSPGMDILVQGDPEMRRPYVVLQAAPGRSLQPSAASRLSDFLCSPAAAIIMEKHAASQSGGHLFFPAESSPAPSKPQALNTP